MKELFSIRNRELTYRIIIIFSLLVSTIIAIVSLIYAHNTIELSKKNIYVLKNSNSLVKADASDITNSYDILMKAQIEEINKLIYQHVPDTDNMNAQIKKAITMSDQSVAKLTDALKQHDYYNSIINQNYYTLLITDSISIDYSTSPHPFQYFGKLKMTRGSYSSFRDIITTGTIEDTEMPTKNNERGFLIRDMRIYKDEKSK